MTEATTKLRVRLGAVEIEYEGREEFLKDEIMPKIVEMMELVEAEADLRKSPPLLPYQAASTIESDQDDSRPTPPTAPTLTTSTIASIMSAESATDLAIAASARLIMVSGQDPITRQQILDEMKTATAYFKKSFVNNHSNTLNTLVKADRMRLVAKDTYTLSPKERKALESILRKAYEHDIG